MATKKRSATSPPGPDKLIESLRRFIRTQGPGYLQDPNVSSIGIGYKEKRGRRKKEISLQFTVDRKVAPEGMRALGTTPLPDSITVDGVAVPTDVIERRYETHFDVVPEPEIPDRKKRLDPIMPGASVAHVKSSAGTIGAIVFDKNDGTPYILSNWHVLHGRRGTLGDDVAQPGPHDDNRVTRNRVGTVKRSHLGMAGDCAVATIENRGFDPEIHELGVVPKELGEPALDDKVVKSGRTTGVTHGIVRRIETLIMLDYGPGVGTQTIGGFEVGVDPDNPPGDGEVSLGGDSGSVWMFKTRGGKPSNVMAGLHFGGESANSPDEHALACIPRSVFEKLEISLAPPALEAAEVITGYDPDFLVKRIDPPKLNAAIVNDAVKVNGSEIIPYVHFSLAHSTSRRFAFWVGWNIDGGSLKRLSRNGIKFVKDQRLPAEVQVGNEVYGARRLDRGHIARRADLLWGSPAEAKVANTDSFFFTNITPQMEDFNQSNKGGLWGKLEDAIFEDVEVDDLKVSAFGGPVFQDDDRLFRGVRIPREFWKVIAFSEQGVLKAKAFLLTQNLNQLEALELDEFLVFQVNLGEVEARGRLRFPTVLHQADTLVVPEALEDREPLRSLADIQWH
ncbi:DNA/RNA non-specific endonuclease [Streptomyces sp. LX-29]|uniref:DNA/RNA non-specific endonuclease n=1 Tax=Streptomyces sp. LX-29 TaxID=2900152 RepID=UPI00240DA26C|nr:DNA/RNA non-specific endonuclease [Streptomyces sp. LX-29]WFB05905.1 DNA/RNA non-specific endonuclease [Streptomyces sp. LX-29]